MVTDELTVTASEIVDAVCLDHNARQFGPVEDAIRAMLTDAVSRAESREVYVIQDEGGDVIDVTWSRAFAERETDSDDPNVPVRSFVEDTVWYGEVTE